MQEQAIACYRIFLSGLLDLTDNIVEGEVVGPERTVRYDDDDPYLVVAADKGTAGFSDIANEVAASYGFWLGDAFASGGSHGYDHKRMGITARGAWESVKRHFRELGTNIALERVQRGRDRRHVRRRVRKRDAALAHIKLLGGVQPPARVPRSRSRSRAQLPGAQAAVRARTLRLE